MSERQLSARLFSSCSKCLRMIHMIDVSLVVTPAGNAVLATRRRSHVMHLVIHTIQRRQAFNLQQDINRWFGTAVLPI